MSETPSTSPPAADTRPLTDVCFDHFTLHPLLLQGLTQANFVRLTPIQALTLPLTLAGRDVAGQAQTGTGKTLAFLVTIMNRLLSTPAHAERRAQDPRAVVLAPTRELAIQIKKDADSIAPQSGLRFALIYGGVDYDKQRELLRAGTDVVIATPGRLIDYVKQHVVNLASTEIVVLDEADRMFDLGFIKDIRFLLRKMPAREQRQSLLFSATLSHRVLELAYEHMNEPEKLTVETDSITADRVRQQLFFPASEEKIPLLIGLLSRMDAHRTMVFVNTKAWVERVARALERAHFSVGVLSGDVPQPKREKLLTKFKKGELEILVATDVAARGLHIPDVSHVFNFDLPFDAEDYVHRIGRTARLGAEGDAISFACDLYAMSLPEIEKYIDQKIPVGRVEADLLQPVARQPRAAPPPGEDSESISEILHGADANALRDRQRDRAARDGSGPGRGRAGPPRRGGPRRDGAKPEPRREREGAKPEPRRERDGAKPEQRREREAAGPEPRRERARAPASGPATEPRSAAPAAAHPEGSEAPRKRRRRGGRGRRRGEAGQREQAAPAPTERSASQAQKPHADSGAKPEPNTRPRLMSRLGQGIKSLVNRLPLPGRRR